MSNELSVIDNTIQNVTGLYQSTVVKHHYSLVSESQLLAAKKQLMKTDFAMKVAAQNPQSVHDAIMTAAVLGVDLTEGKRQGWLLPRKGAICFQVGYKGIEAIHQRLGIIDRLTIKTVHQNDNFEWSGDDAEKPVHACENWFDQKSRGEIIGAYCVTYFPDKSFHVVLASITEIHEKHRDISEAWQNPKAKPYCSWTTHPKAMIEKTMAIIASKQWPAHKMSQSDEASQVLEKLHENETADYNLEYKEVDERFMGFFHNKNAIGMYLLSREYIENERVQEWTNLYHSFPKGYKGKMQDEVNRLTEEGDANFTQLKEFIDNDDAFGASEMLDNDRHCKKLVAWRLGEEDTAKLKELLKTVAD